MRDYDAVMRLWQATEGMGLGESDERCRVASFLKRNPRMSFVARNGREIIGAVLCGHDGRRGYLHHLAVSKEHRGQGIGRSLVAKCLARLKAEGILKCNIFLFTDNKAGETFWLKNGWAKRLDIHLVQKDLGRARRQRSC